MKKANLIAIAAFLVLASCARPTWVKPGATQQDYATDSYQCEKDARQSGYFGGGLVGAANMADFASRCMVAHGWRTVDQTAVARSAPKVTQLQEMAARRKTCLTETRQRPIFAPLVPHMSDINTGRFAPSQMANNQHVSASDARLYAAYEAAADPCIDEFLASVAGVVPDIVPIVQQLRLQEKATASRLFASQITWGEASAQWQSDRDAARMKLGAIQL
jgi:hypothetical protein